MRNALNVTKHAFRLVKRRLYKGGGVGVLGGVMVMSGGPRVSIDVLPEEYLAPLPSPLAASRLAGELTLPPGLFLSTFCSCLSLSEPMPLLDCSSSS